jgi:hypothetical protein
MLTFTPAAGVTTARPVEERFVDLICGDADLLAAEFDAIIAAEWPTPPSSPGRDASGGPPRGGADRRRRDLGRCPAWPERQPAAHGRRRQRSPPRAERPMTRQKGR